MDYRNLGRSGLRVSAVGLGCNNFGGRVDLDGTRAVVHKALDLGVTLFDTADSYAGGQSEVCLGEVLGPRRKDVVLATKFAQPHDKDGRIKGASRAHVMRSVELSLRRLKTDWIDLYQQHRMDPLTPIEETLRALDDLVRQGKVRYIGNSNFDAWRTVEAVWTARQHGLHAFVSCQDEYSLVARDIERERLPAMQAHGLGLLPYYPLASGLLTGKYVRGQAPPPGTRFAKAPNFARPEANWAVVARLEPFCTSRGHNMLDVAMSWLAGRPTVASIIAGASTPQQVEQNVTAVGLALSPDDLTELDRLTRQQ